MAHSVKILAMSLPSLDLLCTEQIGTDFPSLHSLTVKELIDAMNQTDRQVAMAVQKEHATIGLAIGAIVDRMSRGGRLIYVGAGTSGRLGVLDASECPPTFGVDPSQVVGIIAGGDGALRASIEGAEDCVEEACAVIGNLDVQANDSVVGIAASGRTPYVIGAIEAAKKRGALTVGLSCNKGSALSRVADMSIEIDSGPEILAGSTRLKAGTATKLVLNMISTIAMIKLDKVYQNMMIDVRVSNFKLRARAITILVRLAGTDAEAAESALDRARGSVRHALVILNRHVSYEEADALLKTHKNDLDKVLVSRV